VSWYCGTQAHRLRPKVGGWSWQELHAINKVICWGPWLDTCRRQLLQVPPGCPLPAAACCCCCLLLLPAAAAAPCCCLLLLSPAAACCCCGSHRGCRPCCCCCCCCGCCGCLPLLPLQLQLAACLPACNLLLLLLLLL
jgi:hypothetical protein